MQSRSVPGTGVKSPWPHPDRATPNIMPNAAARKVPRTHYTKEPMTCLVRFATCIALRTPPRQPSPYTQQRVTHSLSEPSSTDPHVKGRSIQHWLGLLAAPRQHRCPAPPAPPAPPPPPRHPPPPPRHRPTCRRGSVVRWTSTLVDSRMYAWLVLIACAHRVAWKGSRYRACRPFFGRPPMLPPAAAIE